MTTEGSIYVFGGKDGGGLRIVSKDADDKAYRCGRLAMFLKKEDDEWVAMTARQIFQKGFSGGPVANQENVCGKVAHAFQWKEGKAPADVVDHPDDMVIDPIPVGEVIKQLDPFQVLVRINPEWMKANKEEFERNGQWMGIAPPGMVRPGMKVQVGLPMKKQ